MQLTVHYSVQNCGDGSAYPQWMESEELAQWDQDHMDEGWGESCIGSITFEGDNITCSKDITTKEKYYLDLLDDDKSTREFVAHFFPNGLPRFDIGILDKKYYGIYLNGKLVSKQFSYPKGTTKAGVQALYRKINHESTRLD